MPVRRADRALIGCIRRSLILSVIYLAACGSDEHPARSIDSGTGGSGPGAGGGASGAAASLAGTAGEGGSALSGSAGAAGSAGAGGSAGSNGDAEDPPAPSCIPRQGCQRLCDILADDPACGLGNVSQCGCACEQRFNGPCPDELDALLACAGDAPSIDCGARGRIFPGCENESFALEACDFQAREQLCAGAYPDCTPYCRGAMLGFCSLGPESVASCLCGCEASLVTTCAAPFEAFMTCTAKTPAFTCDIDGRISATSCPTEWQALATCMTPGP
jgi:hypothetical protein